MLFNKLTPTLHFLQVLCFFVLTWLFLSSAAYPHTYVIEPNPTHAPVKLDHDIYLFQDSSRALDIDQIRSLEKSRWIMVPMGIPSFGYQDDAFWFHFELTNPTQKTLSNFIEIAYPILDDINAYIVSSTGGITQYQMGDNFPYDKRPIDYHDYLVPLEIEPHQTVSVYLRVVTDTAMQVPLILWDREQFFQQQVNHLMGQGLYFGTLLVMIIYNLFIFTVVRHGAYIYYVLSALGVVLLVASLQGFGFKYLWPDLPSINNITLCLALSLYGSFACAFTISLLQLKINSPRFYRLILAIAFAYIPAVIGVFFLPYQTIVAYAIYLSIIAGISELSAGIYMLKKGIRPARYYVMAYSSLIIASIIVLLSTLSILPRNIFTESILQIASTIEVVLLSFALADRINQERKQKLDAQKLALENEHKARMEHERYLKLNYESRLDELSTKRKIIEMEAESRAKTKFLTIMSHEIRTPMNGVLGMAELLSDTPLNDQQKQYVNIINNSGNTLLNIINDILDYSKISAGKMALETTDFDLDKLTLECTSIFTFIAEQKGVELICSLQPNTPVFIKSDPHRLRQVLINLLGNAFKFTNEGMVSLSVKQVETEPKTNKNLITLRFEIKDSGIGISSQNQKELFQPFTQADDSITREYGGTGLGLSISKWLVELMGGVMGVESELGKGSLFWFTINCESVNQHQATEPPPELALLYNKRLLIVDDSPDFAEVIKEQAKLWGMQPRIAYFSHQALEMIEASYASGEPFDFVTLDMNMPGMNGYDCAKSIHDQYGNQAPKCLLLTAIRFQNEYTKLSDAGIHSAIQKPASARVIRDALIELEHKKPSHSKSEPLVTVTETASLIAGKKILIAEDNQVNQLVISKLLDKLGVQTELVNNGQEAINAIKAAHHSFDLLLMDCEMPVLDGFRATESIREWELANNLERLPIVALTSHVMQEHRDKALQSGMDDYLSKPVDFMELQEKIHRALTNPKTELSQQAPESGR